MHIVLTDILTCPSCGEGHGLIVRSDRIEERQVLEGALACPSCERLYPIVDGVAWLDGSGGRRTEAAPVANDGDAAVRIAALLGLDRATGFVLLAGPAARHADAVAALAPGAGIVAAVSADEPVPPARRASRIGLGDSLPFAPGSLRGIWLSGALADRLLVPAGRALHPTARLVLDPAPPDVEDRLPPGLRIAARDGDTVLCTRKL